MQRQKQHRRPWSAAIPAAAALLAVLSSLAFAADPDSGKWAGKLKTNGADVSFKVKNGGKLVKTFAVVQLPVYCYGSGLGTKVFLVPSAKVENSGRFKRVYKTRDHGQVDGKLTVSGRFTSATKASGTLDYVRSGCSSGPVDWTAKRKG
jgi:hypothetical protein